VARAIEDDDWDEISAMLEPGLEAFERNSPLEHVRFRGGLISLRGDHDPVKLCEPGWLARCELEIGRVQAGFDSTTMSARV
jgi:hypothetical protein